MPNKNRPKVGDFILWEEEVWIINEIDGDSVIISCESNPDIEADEEELPINSLAFTNIQTWETE